MAVVGISLGLLAGFTPDGSQGNGVSLAGLGGEIAAEQDHIDPLDLAEWIKAAKPGLRVVDVREASTERRYQIPGSESVPIERVAHLAIRSEDTIVLYSEGGTHAAQAWVLLRARGPNRVVVLRDGLAGWEDEVLSPHPPLGADSAATARFRRARDLSLWFGGLPSSIPRASGATSAGPRRRKNRC